MARPLRIEFPGAVYHVTSRGDRREPIFVDDDARRALLEVLASGLDVTVYVVMAAPPLFAGAVQDTVTLALPGMPETPVGAPGTVRGVTGAEAVLAGPGPALFVALTVKV